MKRISPNIDRYQILHEIVYESDTMPISQLGYLEHLCHMLEIFRGLKRSRNMDIDEQVVIFLHILAHNVNNRVIISFFRHSAETITRHFSRKPELVPDNSIDQRWKWFKNCLGALDGCLLSAKEKPRYITRKNDIATNILGVCSQYMKFIYVLPGWEGSAADGMTSQIRNYKTWKNNEETKLVEALVNMTNVGGFKADNGFKSGYLQHLEKVLKESLLDLGILDKNHEERLEMCLRYENSSKTSRFGYDSKIHCVIIYDLVWEVCLQVHKEATRWKHKSFPYYEDLCIDFGKHRAQGNRARDFIKMEQDVNLEEEMQELDDDFLEFEEISRNRTMQNE
uniref:DUF8040 domain-containing protein n=1 Tax=Lactuca sativa TaxID=4236 RepID=A0A9R1WTS9_LACSA|nr:hypothetical protein LSAT_V11C900471180 [Lactuca sativa]